jgi:hypothetical protein
VLTGTGRVSKGAAFLLDTIGIKKVDPHSFCYKEFDEIVYTQLGSKDMYSEETKMSLIELIFMLTLLTMKVHFIHLLKWLM